MALFPVHIYQIICAPYHTTKNLRQMSRPITGSGELGLSPSVTTYCGRSERQCISCSQSALHADWKHDQSRNPTRETVNVCVVYLFIVKNTLSPSLIRLSQGTMEAWCEQRERQADSFISGGHCGPPTDFTACDFTSCLGLRSIRLEPPLSFETSCINPKCQYFFFKTILFP